MSAPREVQAGRVLVTGANGFLGKHVVARLLFRLGERGAAGSVRALVRPGSDENGVGALGAEVCRGTLVEDADIARMLEGVDVICHVAAAKSGSPMGMFAESVVATEKLMNVVEAMPPAARPRRLVFISSFSVYGGAGLPTGAVFDESCPLEPHPERRDAYAWTKFYQEKVARERSERMGLGCVVLRPGVIYGDGQGLLTTRIGLQLPGLPIFLAFRGSAPVPLTHVENCADAIALACLVPGLPSTAINLVDDETPTQRELLSRIEAARGPIPHKVPLPYWGLWAMSVGFEVMNRVSRGNFPGVFTRYKTRSMYRPFRFSNARAKELLGWQCPGRLDEELARG